MLGNFLKQLGPCNITQVELRGIFVAGKYFGKTGLPYEGNVRRTVPLCFFNVVNNGGHGTG